MLAKVQRPEKMRGKHDMNPQANAKGHEVDISHFERIDKMAKEIDKYHELNRYDSKMINPLSKKYNHGAQIYLLKSNIIRRGALNPNTQYNVNHVLDKENQLLALRIMPYLCLSSNGLRGWIHRLEAKQRKRALNTGTLQIHNHDCTFFFLKLEKSSKETINIHIIYRRKNILSIVFEEERIGKQPYREARSFDIPKGMTRNEYLREIIESYRKIKNDKIHWNYKSSEKNLVEISMLKTVNLGHQLMNQFSGAIFEVPVYEHTNLTLR